MTNQQGDPVWNKVEGEDLHPRLPSNLHLYTVIHVHLYLHLYEHTSYTYTGIHHKQNKGLGVAAFTFSSGAWKAGAGRSLHSGFQDNQDYIETRNKNKKNKWKTQAKDG